MEIPSVKFLHNPLWPIIMLISGVVMVLYQSIGFDFQYMPGDLGDGRFNNYILEHGYRYLLGLENSFWNAPFMFPEKDAITYSDNLIGGLPIYAFFRIAFDRETAFQCWYLSLIVLNFLGGFYALKKLDFSNYSSSMGAFIYAFSLIILLQTGHIQLLVRFSAPLSIAYFYLWLRDNKVNYLYFSSAFLVVQFYCAIYLGYFLLYALIFVFIAFMLLERKWDRLTNLFSKNNWIKTILVNSLVIVLLGLLLYPYYIRSANGSYPPPEELKSMLPRIWSYVYCTSNSELWGWTSSLFNEYVIPKGLPIHELAIFIGFIPFLFFALALIYYRSNKLVKLVTLSLLLFFILTTSFFDFSIYVHVVKYIPGAQAVRAFARIMVIFMFFWCIISGFFLDNFFSKITLAKLFLLFLLPIFLLLDNIQKAQTYVSYKSESKERCKNLVDKFNMANSEKSTIIAFCYQFKTTDFHDLIHNHLDAMMASQIVNVPCINAYTARFPDEYLPYFFKPDSSTLRYWINSEHLKKINKSINKDQLLIIE